MKNEGAAKKERLVPREAIAWAVIVAFFAVVHAICGGLLGGRDVVAAVVVSHDVWPVIAAVGLVSARMFLFFPAPAWGIYIAVKILATRLANRSKSAA